MSAGVGILAVLARLYPDDFAWRVPDDPSRPPFADLLWGSSALREGIDTGASVQEILASSPAAPVPSSTVLLYDGPGPAVQSRPRSPAVKGEP